MLVDSMVNNMLLRVAVEVDSVVHTILLEEVQLVDIKE